MFDFFYSQEEKTSDYHLIEGKFISPLELYIPGLAPTECQQAQFQMLLPLKWADESYKPICIQFAGTGDHVSLTHILFYDRMQRNAMSLGAC